MTKISPGEWTYKASGEGFKTHHLVTSIRAGKAHIMIANCGMGSEAEANARLIAAAPELLEACELVLKSEIPDNERRDGDPLFYDECVFDAWEKAKAAIARIGQIDGGSNE